MHSTNKKILKKRLKHKARTLFKEGMDKKHIVDVITEVPSSTVYRWLADVPEDWDPSHEDIPEFIADEPQEKPLVTVLEVAEKMDQTTASNIIINAKDTPTQEEKKEQYLSSNNVKLRARAMADKLGADLSYQVKAALWMTENRYKLAISSTTMTGMLKIDKVPVLPENIDWAKQVVRFDGREYGLDCLIPNNKSAKIGLEMLMKLTGTDVETTETIKADSKQRAIEAEIESKKQDQQDSAVAIIMNRPQRKTLEEVLEEQNDENEPRDDG